MSGTQTPTPKNRGGRPRKYASDAKRPTLTFRVRDGLYERLVAAAQAGERSISEEIERRLELSLEVQPDRFGRHNAELANTIALVARSVEVETGVSWLDGEAEATAVFQRLSLVLATFMGAVERPEKLIAESPEHPNRLFRASGQTRSPEHVEKVQSYAAVSRDAESEAIGKLSLASVAKWREELAAARDDGEP